MMSEQVKALAATIDEVYEQYALGRIGDDTLRTGVEAAIRAALADARQSAGQERGEAVAWLTEDGERCVTARTMNGARKDGGAILSSLSSFTVPAYTAPADAQSRIAELESALVLVRMSAAWAQLSAEAKAVIESAIEGGKNVQK